MKSEWQLETLVSIWSLKNIAAAVVVDTVVDVVIVGPARFFSDGFLLVVAAVYSHERFVILILFGFFFRVLVVFIWPF